MKKVKYSREMLKSKIHRATVTDADVDYEGSITIDQKLMHLANLLPHEKVDVLNVTNGERFSTYVIPSKKDSGEICINGAAAHLAKKGDIVIIVSYVTIDDDFAADYKPTIVHVNSDNNPQPRCCL